MNEFIYKIENKATKPFILGILSVQILVDEFDDPELPNFAVENISELFGYLATGRVNIRICRDITGEMWFGVG